MVLSFTLLVTAPPAFVRMKCGSFPAARCLLKQRKGCGDTPEAPAFARIGVAFAGELVDGHAEPRQDVEGFLSGAPQAGTRTKPSAYLRRRARLPGRLIVTR